MGCKTNCFIYPELFGLVWSAPPSFALSHPHPQLNHIVPMGSDNNSVCFCAPNSSHCYTRAFSERPSLGCLHLELKAIFFFCIMKIYKSVSLKLPEATEKGSYQRELGKRDKQRSLMMFKPLVPATSFLPVSFMNH